MSEQTSPPKIAMDAPSSNACAPEPEVTVADATGNPPATSNPLVVNVNTSTGSASDNNTPQPSTINPAPSQPGLRKTSKKKPDLTADVNAILADYDNILSRIEQENADMLASARRMAASRKNMTRAFDDVAKARQRMSTIFEKARAASTASQPSPSPNAPYGATDATNAPAHHTHKRTPSELSRMDLERKRWDVMTRYEELYRERKEVDAEVEKILEKRGKDAEWIQGMFSRVAEKGLFEAAVVREKKRTPVVLDDEDDDGHEGEEVEY